MSPQRAEMIGKVILCVALINFIAFIVHTRAIGGGALTRAHGVSLFITHPLAILVAVPLLMYAQRARKKDSDGLAQEEETQIPQKRIPSLGATFLIWLGAAILVVALFALGVFDLGIGLFLICAILIMLIVARLRFWLNLPDKKDK
jgi:membrane protein implicated in regulation of membrane protease activity